LASNTTKRGGKATSPLGLFFNLVVVVGVAVSSPWVFHGWRRKWRVGDRIGGLKTHRCAHLLLALL
jgi:hypothetical protein